MNSAIVHRPKVLEIATGTRKNMNVGGTLLSRFFGLFDGGSTNA
jgi:hypothetical protein